MRSSQFKVRIAGDECMMRLEHFMGLLTEAKNLRELCVRLDDSLANGQISFVSKSDATLIVEVAGEWKRIRALEG